MLGKLVNKFKRQTLQDGIVVGGSSSPSQHSPPPIRETEINGQGGATTRRSARLNEKAEKERCEGGVDIINSGTVSLTISTSSPNTRSRRSQLESTIEISEQQKFSFKPSFVNNGNNKLSGGITTTSTLLNHSLANCDSGTESSEDENDEELEMLDSLSNASRAALEEGIGRSPPTLTSSPPLISEIETSSWDSCGCESGIVLRDSAERDDASRNVDLLEAALGGGELVLDINGIKQINDEIAGTTPIQSKGAFPAHFLSSSSSSSSIIRTCGSTGTLPLPIDFSALRQSEHLFSVSSDDTPTPIGSHKTSGQGAALMEMAIVENRTKTEEQSDAQHQGAFRRVLRRNRRNSNSQPITTSTSNVLAARTISPFGLGEKRRWGDQNVILNDNSSQESLIQQQQQQQQPERSETPIAGRTRSMLMANALMLQNGSTNIDNSNNDRQVLTAARRTRVRILYSSSQHQQQQKGGGGGISSSIQTTTIQGRRGQVAPILGQSPPYMLANKRGRHCSNKSPPRPSLNFDKMRRRMLSSNNNNNNNMENLNENIREKNGGGTN